MDKKISLEWLLTLLFCIFLGVFGMHRFFTGNKDTGLAMLLITILLWWVLGLGILVTAIWSFVDLIAIVSGNFTTAENKKLHWYAECNN